LIKQNNNVVIVTATASGKTLCYNLPVFNKILNDKGTRALYLFPTKALAHDQLAVLKRITKYIDECSIKGRDTNTIITSTYDGDTPIRERKKLRESSNIILTNPDMLHHSILPNHTKWEQFIKCLCFIVIDEIHIYRGVFGSHVANVIRRLKRISRFYGMYPLFILTSATIGNPSNHANQLIEEPIFTIMEDGSPQCEKHFLIYNPPLIDEELGLRASLLSECVKLANHLFEHGTQTLIFGRTRRTIELLLNKLRNEINNNTNGSIKKIRAYRSGYLSKQRREIEAGLRSGEINIVVATNALELGIDIGQMRAVILAGFPGSISATWQQAGRAGRNQESSLVILIASSSPIDQYLARYPDYIFECRSEHARINADNLLILLEHLKCTVFEIPLSEDENFGSINYDGIHELLEILKREGLLHLSGINYYWKGGFSPASLISLRNASPDRYALQVKEDQKTFTLGEIDGDSVFWMVHPKAIYFHEGQSFHVDTLDIENKSATLQPLISDYYTRPQQNTELSITELIDETHVFGGKIAYGHIVVTERVTGFTRFLWENNQPIDSAELSLPPRILSTQGYLIKIQKKTVTKLRESDKWNNDPNQYGTEWGKKRALARKRDGYCCQVCGSRENDKQHHVHHIKPFRLFSSYQEANDLNNLITLCPGCHRKVENLVYIRSGLTGISYALINLAPLYLLCDTQDIGVLSESTSDLNSGNPLIVIFDRVPGGVGFSKRLFEIHYDILKHAHDLVSSCACENGCPSCVGPGGENGLGSKTESLALLEILTGNNNWSN
jgi:DEAD/DEAH box helicase domain-containing protein